MSYRPSVLYIVTNVSVADLSFAWLELTTIIITLTMERWVAMQVFSSVLGKRSNQVVNECFSRGLSCFVLLSASSPFVLPAPLLLQSASQ